MTFFSSPASLGKYPLTKKQCEAGFELGARLIKQYTLNLNDTMTIQTHYGFGKRNPKTSSFGKIDIIYLMKKYKWSLNKSMQYIKSKKNDVEVLPFFYTQLERFQEILVKNGELRRDIPWEFEGIMDENEKLLRNTYMNGLPPNKLIVNK